MMVDFESGDLADGGELDDLAISGSDIQMLRLERMSPDYFWGAIYLNDGRTIRLSIHAKRSKLSFTAERE